METLKKTLLAHLHWCKCLLLVKNSIRRALTLTLPPGILRHAHTERKRTQKWKRSKNKPEEIKEKISNNKENFRFRVRSVWLDPYNDSLVKFNMNTYVDDIHTQYFHLQNINIHDIRDIRLIHFGKRIQGRTKILTVLSQILIRCTSAHPVTYSLSRNWRY